MVETIFLYVGLVFFILYNVFMTFVNNKEIPESISETSYISKEHFGTTIPFTALCIISAVCIFPLWILVSPVNFEFLVFLSCTGMMFAGTTPLFNQKFDGRIHYTSGIIAFISGIAWLLLTHNYITLGLIAIIGGIWTLFQKEKYTFIFEVVPYITLCITLLTMI